jgi:hypothetical protein
MRRGIPDWIDPEYSHAEVKMSRWRYALWGSAVFLTLTAGTCEDQTARQQIQALRDSLNRWVHTGNTADAQMPWSLHEWLDSVGTAVCNLERHTAPPDNLGQRLCPGPSGPPDPPASPPPPPPF